MADEEKKETKKIPESNYFVVDGKQVTEEGFSQWVDDQCSGHPVVNAHHGQWKEIIDWTDNGNQFSVWDVGNRRMSPVELRRRKKKIVINLMKPLSEAIESKINLYYKVAGQPNSAEQKDIFGAEVAGKLIDYNDYTNSIEERFDDVKYDMTRTGQGAVKCVWDGGMAARGKTRDNGESVAMSGDVLVEHVPIFNLRPDPMARNQKQLRWMIEIIETSREELKEKFLKYKRITEQEIEEASAESEDEKAIRHAEANEGPKGNLVIKEFREIPSSAFGKGRHIFVFNKKAIFVGENDNPNGHLGYFFYYFKKSPYSFWGRSPLFFVQPIQREFNRTVSMISEHVEAWRPKMAVGQGALKRAGSMTVDSFEIVEVDFSRGEPRPITMPELSGQVLAYRDFLISSVDRVSNVHEVSYSRLPQYASRAPASLYAMMLEQENMKLDPMIQKTNGTIRDMCKFRLQLMDKHYDKKRMVKIVGENRSASVQYFSKADLNSNFDIRLEIGVSLRQSTTIQQRLLIELWEKNIIEQSPKNRNKISQMLNLGTAEQSFRTDMADIEKAMRENQAFIDNKYVFDGDIHENRMKGGVIWLIDDDHELHIETHVTLLKSEEAAKWEQERWDALVEHINKHREFYMKALAATQGAGMTELPGSPAAPGPATVEGSEPMIEGSMGPEGA
uniref:Portal protein n=1 Tax=viral metagenome TaxID=1070528 RepID=A0A6M3IYX9_9ZZZZ